jgi:hypothetical protein
MLLGFSAQLIQDNAGLDARDAAHGIDFENGRHVFRKVENDGGVATLPGEGRASAACKQGSAVVAAESHRGKNVFFVAWNYDADRDLAIIGAVGGIERTTARVESDLATKMAAERGLKRGGVELCGTGRGCGDVWRHGVQNILEDGGAGRKYFWVLAQVYRQDRVR